MGLINGLLRIRGRQMQQQPTIYALSDSIGETAELVARATASQFGLDNFDIIRVPYVNSVRQIKEVLKSAASTNSVVCHTLVSPQLRAAMAELAKANSVRTVDIMGPMIHAVQETTDLTPKLQPGLMHKLDQEYYRRLEAVELP
jgi:regulator of PEP synthase PpsR (kinase-PPPase family)